MLLMIHLCSLLILYILPVVPIVLLYSRYHLLQRTGGANIDTQEILWHNITSADWDKS
jgi:hypothetical protein